MTSRDFCYWLQGFFELADPKGVGMALEEQTVKTIRNHLNMVFKHEIDPSHGDAAHQEVLQQAHEGKPGKLSPQRRKKRYVEDSGYHKPPKAMC